MDIFENLFWIVLATSYFLWYFFLLNTRTVRLLFLFCTISLFVKDDEDFPGCDTWFSLSSNNLSFLQRYGHSSMVTKHNIFVIGGFNGVMLSDVVKFTPGQYLSTLL